MATRVSVSSSADFLGILLSVLTDKCDQVTLILFVIISHGSTTTDFHCSLCTEFRPGLRVLDLLPVLTGKYSPFHFSFSNGRQFWPDFLVNREKEENESRTIIFNFFLQQHFLFSSFNTKTINSVTEISTMEASKEDFMNAFEKSQDKGDLKLSQEEAEKFKTAFEDPEFCKLMVSSHRIIEKECA
jgi:hypothetical protein